MDMQIPAKYRTFRLETVRTHRNPKTRSLKFEQPHMPIAAMRNVAVSGTVTLAQLKKKEPFVDKSHHSGKAFDLELSKCERLPSWFIQDLVGSR
jgi:hypothetical protein